LRLPLRIGYSSQTFLERAQWASGDTPSRSEAVCRSAVTDPETGLTFGYLRYTETQSNRIFVSMECLYG